MDYPKSDYIEQPKTLPEDDFWGQVKRTIAGKPVGEEQIVMIVDAVLVGLKGRQSDELLDLACGNGALTARLFDKFKNVLGVDISEYLIDIGNRYFAKPPDYRFLASDVVAYLLEEREPLRFTRVLCYAGFQYFTREAEETVLATLRRRFRNVERMFIGNMPDRDRCEHFFGERQIQPGELEDPRSQIGRWTTDSEFAEVARRTGWNAEFSRMPSDYFTSNNRFDITLTPMV